MNYYRIQYMRGGEPRGGYYTVRSTDTYKVGDHVRLYGGKRAVIVGDGDMSYIDRVGNEGIIPIVSLDSDS